MKILNKKPVLNLKDKKIYYLPSENVGPCGDLVGLAAHQIHEDDQIHIAASHSVRAKMRKNKREGDIEIICTATNAFDYSFSTYVPYLQLLERFEIENKIILYLYENKDSLNALEEFGGNEVIKNQISFGYWEMAPYLSFPITSSKNSSIISPPEIIRYARSGILEDDCAWFDGRYLYVLNKGKEIEFSIN